MKVHNDGDMDVTNTLSHLAPLSRNALRHEVVVRLMASIFHGDIPAGARLVIRKMAEQMGVSATPIREALVELEAIGVVQFIHHRGVVVKPFGRQELRDIFHLRRILESEAALCACGHIPADELKTLRREMRQLLNEGEENPEWSTKSMATDQKLHEMIAVHCGNARLVDEIHRYDALIQTTREIVGNRRQAQYKALEEHVPIVNALLAGDAEKAAAAMTQHINDTFEAVAAVMFQNK